MNMRKIEITYSDTIPAILNMSPEIFEREAKLALAAKFFEMGRLTSGQAAQLAGISRVEFLLSCRQYGVASVNWDQEEMEAELGKKDF
jgi:predicted HTH domain antitoxin